MLNAKEAASRWQTRNQECAGRPSDLRRASLRILAPAAALVTQRRLTGWFHTDRTLFYLLQKLEVYCKLSHQLALPELMSKQFVASRTADANPTASYVCLSPHLPPQQQQRLHPSRHLASP